MVVLNDRIGAARFVTKPCHFAGYLPGAEEGYLGVVVGGNPSSRRGWINSHAALGVRCASAEGSAEGGDYLWLPDDPSICTMRRSPIMPTVLSTPEPGRGRCRYVAPPVSKAQQAGIVVVRASRTGSGVVPPDDSQPGLVADSSTRQKRVYC